MSKRAKHDKSILLYHLASKVHILVEKTQKEKFPLQTYCVDAQTPDSAATANAMFTGVKTNYYTMGFDNTIDMGNVTSEDDATKVDSILKWAQDAGKDTGEFILKM